MINDPNYRRRFVISGIAIGVVLVYIIRLFYLQIIDQSTKDQADNNALVKQTIYPSRGLIYDRNGELLVFNQPIYEITMTMREMGKDWDTTAFCRSLQISRAEFDERISEIKDKRKNRGYSRWTPQVFMSQLKKEDIATLQESLFLFPGIAIQKRTLRDYTYKAAAHVLGSVGEVNQNDIDGDEYYSRGDYSGRDGLERTYEKQLRGEKGVEIIMRDSRGRIQGSYQNGELDKTAVAGTDLHTTLDIQLQLLAEQLLAGKIGSAVAIEPKTGCSTTQPNRCSTALHRLPIHPVRPSRPSNRWYAWSKALSRRTRSIPARVRRAHQSNVPTTMVHPWRWTALSSKAVTPISGAPSAICCRKTDTEKRMKISVIGTNYGATP